MKKKYSDETLDLSSRRSIVFENPIEATENAESIHIKQFYHLGRFWSAKIPVQQVGEIYGQAFNFSDLKTKQVNGQPEVIYGKDGLPKRKVKSLNHVQTRFVLKPGHAIELYDLESKSVSPAHRVHDFIYSIEAVGPVGVKFNLRDAMRGHLTCAHRFLSTEEMVFERIVVENQHITESPALPISDSEKTKLLQQSLLRSHHAGMSEPYYLYRFCGTNNCTSSPFQILDQVVAYNLLQRFGSLLYRLPINPRFYLRIRGLDSDTTVRKLVRDEFTEYVSSQESQKRKRQYVRNQIAKIREARSSAQAE